MVFYAIVYGYFMISDVCFNATNALNKTLRLAFESQRDRRTKFSFTMILQHGHNDAVTWRAKVSMEYQPLEYNIIDETNSESLIPYSKTQPIICVDH